MLCYLSTDPIILNGKRHHSITSQNYPKPYPNNDYYLWYIQAPEGYEITIDIVVFFLGEEDYIYIGFGVNRFSRKEKWTILTGADLHKSEFKTNNGSITLIFTSNGRSTDKGFFIECAASKTGSIETTEGKYFGSLYYKMHNV